MNEVVVDSEDDMADTDKTDIIRVEIIVGALGPGTPVWESHTRGKNWLAKIAIDPRAPGGLDRQFADRARGHGLKYIVPTWLVPGTPVEFAGDYYTGGGRRTARRWYGVVTAVTGEAAIFEKYDTAMAACEAAEAFTHAAVSSEDAPLGDVETDVLIAALESRGFKVEPRGDGWNDDPLAP